MKLQNNNKIAEQVMPIDMQLGPMKLHNNNREEIQMGHYFKLPYSAILITQITWKVWNSTLGPMDVVCQFCGAIAFKSEKRNGQVSFEKLCCDGNKTYPGNLLKPHYTITWWSYFLQVLPKHDASAIISAISILNLQWFH